MKTNKGLLGKRVAIVGKEHAWCGHTGTAKEFEETVGGLRLVVELDNGRECHCAGADDVEVLAEADAAPPRLCYRQHRKQLSTLQRDLIAEAIRLAESGAGVREVYEGLCELRAARCPDERSTYLTYRDKDKYGLGGDAALFIRVANGDYTVFSMVEKAEA